MKTFNKEFLKKVLSIQSSSHREERMVAFIKNEIRGIPNVTVKDDSHGNILVTKGRVDTDEFYPCVAAHMDTVHDIWKGFKVIEYEGEFSAKCSTTTGGEAQCGVGGDDKVGIFIALSMLHRFDKIKIAFFSNEEVGCVGSGKVNMTFFEDCGFVWQADRKGRDEVIINGFRGTMCSDTFMVKISPILDIHGYDFSDGGIWTDVCKLDSRGIGISVNNIGCGYYHAHSDSEFVVIDEVETCYDLFVDVIEACGGSRWENRNNTYSAINWWDEEDFYSGHDGVTPYNHDDYPDDDEDLLDDTGVTIIDDDLSAVDYEIKGGSVVVGREHCYLLGQIKCPCPLKANCKKEGGGMSYKKGVQVIEEIKYVCESCDKVVLDEFSIALMLQNKQDKS